jgi:hypothetical protein
MPLHRNQQVHRYLRYTCPPRPINHPLLPLHPSPETSSSPYSSFPSSKRTHPDSYPISSSSNVSATNPLPAKRATASSISWPSPNFSKTSISARLGSARATRSSGTSLRSASRRRSQTPQYGRPDAHSDRETQPARVDRDGLAGRGAPRESTWACRAGRRRHRWVGQQGHLGRRRLVVWRPPRVFAGSDDGVWWDWRCACVGAVCGARIGGGGDGDGHKR